jgi:hypothetical protein
VSFDQLGEQHVHDDGRSVGSGQVGRNTAALARRVSRSGDRSKQARETTSVDLRNVKVRFDS